jgi:hypothetical protein
LYQHISDSETICDKCIFIIFIVGVNLPELTETFENKNNNKIPEEKMAALYATVIKKNIYEEYDEEYGVKPIYCRDKFSRAPLLSVCLSGDWRTLAHQWLCRFRCVL